MRKFEERVNSRFDKLEHNLESYRSELDEVKEVIGEIKSCSTAKTPDGQSTDPISPTSEGENENKLSKLYWTICITMSSEHTLQIEQYYLEGEFIQ